VKGSCLRPIAAGWQIGSALLLFAMAGQAFGSATISGTVKPAANGDVSNAFVVATSDTFKVYRATVDPTAGTYSQDVDPGTYTIVVLATDQTAPPITNKVLKDGDMVTQDFTLATATPFPIVKSPNPIPLTDGIDSASFQDAPDILINGGQNVVVGDPNGTPPWTPNVVSGRFRMKYSTQALHIAADVNYMTPRANTFEQSDPTMLWNGNALEFDFQNDPYDATRTAYDNDHDWQLVVSLGDTPNWFLHGGLQAAPMVNGKAEPLAPHFAIQDKPAATPGETFRLDVPWSIFLDSNGKPISPPADNSMAAMDLALDASDPTASKDTAVRLFQATWSGFEPGHANPSVLRPIQFVPQAPAAAPATSTCGAPPAATSR
jgi:hypothetical protein